jgi:integrase
MATVRKRPLPSGKIRWQASYVDAAGQRRGKLFKREGDATAWLTKVARDVQLGTHVPDSASKAVRQACADYVEWCRGRMNRREQMTRKFLQFIEGIVDNHICHPETGIGATKLTKLTKGSIEQFADRLREAGMSVATTRKTIGVLARVMDRAISNSHLTINHARSVRIIGTRDEAPTKVVPPAKEDLRTLLGTADDRLKIIIMFAAATGLRAGELWARRWRDLNLTSGELTVDSRVDAWGDLDVTKTAAGMRTVPVGAAVLTEMKAWKLRSKFSSDDDLIFPNSKGGYRSHTNFTRRRWHALFAKMERAHNNDETQPAPPARIKWHALRHFAISTWIEAGMTPKTIQTFAGHSTLALTMSRYGHLFKSESHKKVMDDIAGSIFS